jgi:imidazolonepropionase-like amidohydrolase
MTRVALLLAFALALLTPLLASAQDSNATLIQNATILTITHGNIEHGSVLIQDGKIVAVGTDIKAPAGATVIDANGQFVMPGIIDCHSHIAV